MKKLKTFELFGLGSKGMYTVGTRVKIKDESGDWLIDKFLGKKDGFEKYIVRDPSGSGKTLEVFANQIIR